MKKIILFGLQLIIYSCCMAQGFTVNKFNADISISKEGYVDVVEKYEVNFTQPKHGLLRDIITRYHFKNNQGVIEKRVLEISNIEVPGNTFTRTPKLVEKFAGSLLLRIGNPNQLVTGKQFYEIRYRVNKALIISDSVVQFYWNIKPSGWQADFKQISFSIHTPTGTTLSAQNSFTYAGNTGDSLLATEFNFHYADGLYEANSKNEFLSSYGQNVTVLLKLPKTAFAFAKKPGFFSENKGWIGIIVAMFGLFALFWMRYGKDKKVISATAYYPPKGMDPALAGYLIDDSEDSKDLISFLPKWGAEGLIKLEEIPAASWFQSADLKITRLANLPANAPIYEQTIFNGLFNGLGWIMNLAQLIKDQTLQGLSGTVTSSTIMQNSFAMGADGQMHATGVNSVKMSDLKNSFYKDMQNAKAQLKNKAKQYYEVSGEKALIIAVVVTCLLTLVVPTIFLFKFGIIAAGICFIACLIMVSLSFSMRKKNEVGNQLLAELKGFYQFIKMADAQRIKTLIAADPNYFEKTMSYALAFGLLNKWAAQFDDLNLSAPSWYSSPSLARTSALSMSHFSKHFSSSIQVANSAMVSSPSSGSSSSHSSGGGGSSGGGFGGGGGSSW